MIKLDPINAIVGRRIKDKRCASGLSPEQLGALVGVTAEQIRNYEAGMQGVAVARLHSISEALGISASELISEPKASTPAILSDCKSSDNIEAEIEVILHLAKIASSSDPLTRGSIRNSSILKAP